MKTPGEIFGPRLPPEISRVTHRMPKNILLVSIIVDAKAISFLSTRLIVVAQWLPRGCPVVAQWSNVFYHFYVNWGIREGESS